MNTYRKKQSIYILNSIALYERLQLITGLICQIFERPDPQMLLRVRLEIENTISYIDRLPVYGKEGVTRKPKGSIYSEHRVYLLDELRKIRFNADEAFRSSRDRVLKGADLIQQLNELKNYAFLIPVYCYGTDQEVEAEKRYQILFSNLKKSKAAKQKILNASRT